MSGTVPCTSAASPSEGISGVGYIATYGYDNLDCITGASMLDGSSNPLADAAQGGPFEYGSGAKNGDAPLYGVTSVGIPGQQMTYDTLRRLLTWQNAPGSMAASGAAYPCRVRARGEEAAGRRGAGCQLLW